MADTVGDIVTRIKDWMIDTGIENEELWALMDEIIDEVMDTTDPWFCFNFGSTARTAINHMNDNDLIPPAKEGGVLAVDADIASGSTVPDNSEYLRVIVFPSGLTKPIQVFYGDLSDDVQLDYIGFEEFCDRYPHTTGTSGDTPAHWSTYNDTFLIGPTPPLETTINVFGVYRPAKISSSGDSNIFVTEVDRLLRYGVLNKLVLYNYEEDTRDGLFDREYNKILRKIKLRGRHQTYRVHRVTSRRAGTWRT